MESYVSLAFFGFYFALIFLFFSSVAGVGNNVQQFEQFTKLQCDGLHVCLESTPFSSMFVGSQVECGLECVRQKQTSRQCVGVNYRRDKNVCDIFYSGHGSNFTKNDADCQYIQVDIMCFFN